MNPLLGPLLRRKEQLLEDELMIRKANRIATYYLNINKKYDLDNYLSARPVSPMDWIRAAWYFTSIFVGYADTYRNEQYIPRTDFVYEHESKMLAINFRNPNTLRIGSNLVTTLDYELSNLLEWWFDDKDDND